MCGIVAIHSERHRVSTHALEQAMNQLIHRGPDQQRHWTNAEGNVGLGHTRLSIIDLSTGDQPITNETQTATIIVNGEFYGYEAIMDDLKSQGHRFRTRSDSEIALHLYEDQGTACLSQLRGEFAFVIWDQSNQLLFAARDRFGIKPLFYCLAKDTLYIASEIKAILAAGVSGRWAEDGLFGTAFPSEHETVFDGIYQVPAGHFLLFRNQRIQLHQYWDFDYPVAADLPVAYREEEYIEAFRDVFDEAVRIRMRADVPVGCYLSGGLDSCAVLGFMSRHTSQPVHSFTLAFDMPEYDESQIAKDMADTVGATYHSIPITQSDLADHFSDAIWHSETLFANGHGMAKFLLSRAVHEAGFKVVFTGEGADEILAGYAHYRRDMLLHNLQGQEQGDIQVLLEQLQTDNPVAQGILLPHGVQYPTTSVRKMLGFVPTWIESLASLAQKLSSFFDDGYAAARAHRDNYKIFLNSIDIPRQLKGRDPVNQSLYLWAKTTLPNYNLNVLGDRMEMAHSVEGRVPFLDHHVVEFMRNIPISMKIRGMTEKYLLRQAAQEHLTPTVYKRQKHPFYAPPLTLSPQEPLYNFMQETLRGSALSNLPAFDQKKIINFLDHLGDMSIADKVAYDPILMLVLSACVLQERFRLS